MEAKHFELISLKKDTSEPLYQQLADEIAQQIESGILPPEHRLPATRELADLLGVARVSVVNAYQLLKDEGYIQAHVGRGTYVRSQSDRHAMRPSIDYPQISQRQTLNAVMQMANRPGVISFGRGAPPEEFLPVGLIREAINEVLSRDGADALAYEDAEGYFPLRRSIAQLLRGQHINVQAEEVLITGGCQQALDLVVQSLLKPGDLILTGSPTYTGMLRIANARGIQVVGVPVTEQGMDVDQLEWAIEEHQPALIYIAPTYQNPTGSVMPMPARRRVIDLAARYQIPILEDGVYEELSYEGQLLPALKSLDEDGLVLYASSFSKVLLPGMRIGYLVASERLLRRLTQVKQAADVCTPALNQRSLQAVIERGSFRKHLLHVRKACLQRRSAMVEAFRTYLPQAAFHIPEGGLYLWVGLPEHGPSAVELFTRAVRPESPEALSIAFVPGQLFYPVSGGSHQMRFNMVGHPPEIIDPAIQSLAVAYSDLLQNGSRAASSTPLL